MLRIFALPILLAIASAQQGGEKINSVFRQSASSDLTDLKCSNIEGTGKGCYECYDCSDPNVEIKMKRRKSRTEFQLFDNECSKTDICCFVQSESVLRSKDNKCGQTNPEGYPMKVRPSLKSVLQGEYPWRAWIYNKTDSSKPLCAGVFISEDPPALMTSATCVHQCSTGSLWVRFSKNITRTIPYDIKSIYIHHDFDSTSRFNDIAVIGLSNTVSLPIWVKQACRPEFKRQFATSCTAISDQDYHINTVIPLQAKCLDSGIKLDEAFMCTVSARDDYEPEFGGGLICSEEEENAISYTAYGITLYRSDDTSVVIHTNVTHFRDWVQEKIDELANT